MPEYRALVEAESWSTSNVVASVILLVIVVVTLVWLVRRFLAD